jgi:hypothetical protein
MGAKWRNGTDGIHDSIGRKTLKWYPENIENKKLITTAASAEYVINPVLYADFKRVYV